MACIDRTTWNAAVAACNAQSSVKGLGIWSGKRRTAMAGLGILGDTNTLNVSAGTDPCAIAAQTPCDTPPPPPPVAIKSFCSSYPNSPSCKKSIVTTDLTPVPPPPTVDTKSKTAGYMKIGLLAALVVVGGVVVYKSTHKKAS